jgi:hypothetical protein
MRTSDVIPTPRRLVQEVVSEPDARATRRRPPSDLPLTPRDRTPAHRTLGSQLDLPANRANRRCDRIYAPHGLARSEKALRRASPRPRRRPDRELTSSRAARSRPATGQTNREVAAQLFTTVGTVEQHLTRIYRKLAVRSRTELARRVARLQAQRFRLLVGRPSPHHRRPACSGAAAILEHASPTGKRYGASRRSFDRHAGPEVERTPGRVLSEIIRSHSLMGEGRRIGARRRAVAVVRVVTRRSRRLSW